MKKASAKRKKNMGAHFLIFFFFWWTFWDRQLANTGGINRAMASGTCKIFCFAPRGLNKNLDMPAMEGQCGAFELYVSATRSL